MINPERFLQRFHTHTHTHMDRISLAKYHHTPIFLPAYVPSTSVHEYTLPLLPLVEFLHIIFLYPLERTWHVSCTWGPNAA